MLKRLAIALALAAPLAAVPWLQAQSPSSGDATLQARWAGMTGKRGHFKTLDGRVIFAHEQDGVNGPAVVESVDRDHVTIAAGGNTRQWRYTIPLERIELHIFR